MLHLYHSQGDYCLVNTNTFTSSGWRETAAHTIRDYFSARLAPYPRHTCFTDNSSYDLVGTYTCTTLKEFYDNYPELFI